MATENGPSNAKRQRQTPDQFYGTVKTPVEMLEDFMPPHTAKAIREMVADLRENGGASLIYRRLQKKDGKVVREDVININLPGGDPSRVIEAELIGEWKGGNRLAHGLIPGIGGNWFRKVNPDAPKPIKDVGEFVGAGQVIGLIGIGKGPDGKVLTQPFVLHPEKFPLGATIVGMPHPNGAVIIPNKTVVALVVPK